MALEHSTIVSNKSPALIYQPPIYALWPSLACFPFCSNAQQDQDMSTAVNAKYRCLSWSST
ncbi:hypothetical protein CERZMDRAFT_89530 [Cercospora zeae-maydis SCOH1-5]|uniref:Uncharacterized protein n=1 Tax=Cercospora zeae-maydis SCOH1-5 TaxID=717836 RepID=A0A6A6FVQ5_9PEZI|nr:hypothetical protein CERZMDRAFT_89530 [Cercospora zeae-maydis SCOH1-5]